MDNIADQGKSEKISQLEKDLDSLKHQAKKEYQIKKVTSPVRASAIYAHDRLKSSVQPGQSSATEISAKSDEKKPTYLEEEQLTNLNNAVAKRKEGQIGVYYKKETSGKAKFILWIGISLFCLSLIVAGLYLLIGLKVG